MGSIAQFEGDVVHPRRLALQKIDGVVVGTASHEHKEVFDPIRHAKTQYVTVERRHVLRTVDDEGEMSAFRTRHYTLQAGVWFRRDRHSVPVQIRCSCSLKSFPISGPRPTGPIPS